MSDAMHSLAPHHLPRFIPGADGSDPLFAFVAVLLVVLVLLIGVFYLKLHSLPEQMAHRQSNTQLQLIAVLAVLALFTHNNVFWVLALLLAVVRLPDFTTPLNSIAASLEILSADKTAPGDKPAPVEEQSAAKAKDNSSNERHGQEST